MESRYSEEEIIARVFAPIAGEGALGLRDDAALLPPSSDGLVVTTDAIVAGVHFFADDAPGLIAKKALRVNLSDLAAKGADPLGFLLTLALPDNWTNEWLEAFAAGLAEDARAFGAPLLGGDTASNPGPLTISITALGRTPPGRFVARSGARAGDFIYVSGTIGDAALGLALRRDASLAERVSPQSRDYLLDRYLLPRPRVALAGALRQYASAAMDVSDGLAGDLTKLARASGVSARVELARVPLSSAAREMIALDAALIDLAVTGGDDYEILCCVPPDESGALEAAAREAGERLEKIGEIIGGKGAPEFFDAQKNKKIFKILSFSHF
jgi:thiamine-monophosphate kinase